MDCVTAQQLVSDALDKIPVDAEALAEAKSHCGQCADCGAFVRTLLAVQRVPLPAVPDGLADRIVEQVRSEATAAAYARTRALAAPGGPARQPVSVPPVFTASEPVGRRDLASVIRDPRNRKAVVAWMSSAAVLFILAGWGAVLGVRSILVPTAGIVEYEFTGTDTLPAEKSASEGSVGSAADPSALQAQAESPKFITAADGLVYRVGGPATEVERDSLSTAGEAGTDLGTRAGKGGAIYRAQDGTLFIEDEEKALLSLQDMTLAYGGGVYELISEPIRTVGEWPNLPEGLDEPRREDGSPTFEEANRERPDGVFVLKGGSASEGIALAPKTTLVEPLTQCPNWTFWRLRK